MKKGDKVSLTEISDDMADRKINLQDMKFLLCKNDPYYHAIWQKLNKFCYFLMRELYYDGIKEILQRSGKDKMSLDLQGITLELFKRDRKFVICLEKGESIFAISGNLWESSACSKVYSASGTLKELEEIVEKTIKYWQELSLPLYQRFL